MALRRAKPELSDKIKLEIDVPMCDILASYSISKIPTKNHLANLRRLIDILDLESYRFNYDIYNRLLLIKNILEFRNEKGMQNTELIRRAIVEKDASIEDLANGFDWNTESLTVGDCTAITEFVDEKMQYYCFYCEMPKIVEIWNSCNVKGINTSGAILREVADRMSRLVMRMQSSSVATSLLRRFSFSDPKVEDMIKLTVKKAQRPTAILQTGMRQLNAILGPGFRGGKVYTFLGASGRFKSGTLLNIADQITKFNPQLEPVVDGMRNTVLFVTMENTIEETIERIFSMYADSDADFLTLTPEEVCNTIRQNGRFVFDDVNGIDIEFRYFRNLEIKTNQLYHVINDMEAHGQHVIALILDYLKRIDSEYPHGGDETLRVTYAIKELKSLGEFFSIPIITAQQFNRGGNSILDCAMREGKQDLLRFLGNSDIGGAWSVVEESDWVALINLERRTSDGKLFLSMKRTKQRAGADDMSVATYFNHPFANDRELRLDTDVDKEDVISISSLATELESVELEENDSNVTQQRPRYSVETAKNSILESMEIMAASSDVAA